jgi:hypothetical protein
LNETPPIQFIGKLYLLFNNHRLAISGIAKCFLKEKKKEKKKQIEKPKQSSFYTTSF